MSLLDLAVLASLILTALALGYFLYYRPLIGDKQ